MAHESFHVISNTHWDREWYQSHEKYLVRLIELMDRLVDIMEDRPAYRFITDGQFALVEDYLAAKPENRSRVEALVKEGRLLVGPWYTQPLENIVGGEALVRNLNKGIAESEKLGGAMRFSYEIDEFGHTSQLPQILAGFGIEGIMAWRGVPNFCRSCFRWSAPDGTTAWFFNSNAGYGEATDLTEQEDDYTEIIDGTEIERDGLKTMVGKIRELRRKVSDSDEMLWLNGIDHSWAQEDILDICERIEELYPEYSVKQSTPEDYMKAVIADLEKKGITPENHTGELLFTNEPVLESTNALHPRQKRRHYESEKLLVREVEPLTAIAAALGDKYPAWALEREWKYVLENHAHDSLGCCSVDEVYEQVMARYGASISLGEQVKQNALRYIMSCSSPEPSLWLFNFSEKPFEGALKAVFDIPEGFGGENIALVTPDGKAVKMSVISKEMQGDVRYNPRLGHPTWGEVGHFEAIIDAPAIPAYGATRLAIKKAEPSQVPVNRQNYYFAPTPATLENKNIRIDIQPNGTFDLIDKMHGERFYLNQLTFTDDGEAGNCYVHIEPQNDMRRLNSLGCAAEIATLYDTPLGAAAQIKIKMAVPTGITPDRRRRTEETADVEITAVLSLERDSESVKIDIHIENRCRNHRIRVLFPSGISDAAVSESGQAYDEVEREISVPEIEGLAEMPYMTHPMIDYCAVAGKGCGMGVAARGIYEYECTDTPDRALAITLLRSIEVIDNATFQTTPQYFMHEAQNLTGIDYSLNLIPYGGERESLLPEVSRCLCYPEAYANRDTEDSVMPGYQLPDEILGDVVSALTLEGEGLKLECLKKADKTDGIIIRVRNRTENAVNGKLSLNPILAGKQSDLPTVYEDNLEEVRLREVAKGMEFSFTAPAKKILTFEIAR